MLFRRIAALCAALVFPFFLQACSSNSIAPLPSNSLASSPLNVSARHSASTTVSQSTEETTALSYVRLAGPIVAVSGTSFQIQSPTEGYEWIRPTSSTAEFYQGMTPALNEYAIITVSGSLSSPTPILAALYTSAPAVTSVTGSITSQQPYGIVVKNAAGVYVPVALSTISAVTVALNVGTTVTVSGLGTAANGVAFFANTVAGGTSTPPPTPTPAPTPTSAPTPPPATAFMPSSAGKISAYQIFDEMGSQEITSTAAAADGSRYAAVWGARPALGATWQVSNASIKDSYYFLMETDMSTTAWGAIGHSLSWWQANHPDWVLYACTSTGTPTTTPAYDVSGLPNVPLNIRNSSVISYQLSQAATYAVANHYKALAADEATFWFPGSGGKGYYPCGYYSNGSFVRLYSGPNDPSWATDVVNWVKAARSIAHSQGLELIVNHPGEGLNTNEETLLSNVDADLDEDGFTFYGSNVKAPVYITNEIAWMRYAQSHGAAVLINQDWGSTAIGAAQMDYSIATYLLGNEQAAALFTSPHTGYGIENWHSEYSTNVGAACGEYYTGSSSSLLYRKFANVLVVVNAGGSGTLAAALPSGHSYTDMEGRAVTNPLSIAQNDGYVLKTTNGCT